MRGDFEHKEADITTTFFAGLTGPPNRVHQSRTSTTSRRSSRRPIAYAGGAALCDRRARLQGGRLQPRRLRSGNEPYGEEHSWSYEGGLKTLWLDDRLSANLSVFFIDWNDMQLNVPQSVRRPASFYINNVAGATSKGMELEMNARVAAGCDLFAGAGIHRHDLRQRTASSGDVSVDGLRVTNTPRYTADFGGQYSVARLLAAPPPSSARNSRSADSFFYDDFNTTEQEA